MFHVIRRLCHNAAIKRPYRNLVGRLSGHGGVFLVKRNVSRSQRILIVEDEPLIGLMIEELLRELGYRVSGIAPTTAEAHIAFAKRNFDAVLLDLNLAGEYHPETADVLLELGIPFAFVTGYEYLVEPRHEEIPVLEKPFTLPQLGALLNTLFGSKSRDQTAKRA